LNFDEFGLSPGVITALIAAFSGLALHLLGEYSPLRRKQTEAEVNIKEAEAASALTGAALKLVTDIQDDNEVLKTEIASIRSENQKLVNLRKADIARIRELERNVLKLQQTRDADQVSHEKEKNELILKIDQLIQVVRRLAKQVQELGADPEIDSGFFDLWG
jgi:hypothetical protein